MSDNAEQAALVKDARERVRGLLKTLVGEGIHNAARDDTVIDMVAEMAALGATAPIAAVAMGRRQERADVIAMLEGRKRAATTIAAKNPDQAERAQAIVQQIDVEIDAVRQGLHEGCAAMAGEGQKEALARVEPGQTEGTVA